MDAMTVVFKKVKGRARESGRKEEGSGFWSKQQIEALDHVLPQLGGGGGLEGQATSFALLSPTGNLVVAQFAHGADQNTINIGANQAGGMAGFSMKRLVLDSGYNDKPAGTNIGSLEGVFNFGPSVTVPVQNMNVGISQAQSPGKYSGKLGSPTAAGMPNSVDFKPMSPLELSGITFGKGVFGKATLKPTHPMLSGLNIPATIENGKLGIFYTIDATQIAEKVKIPGVKIDAAGITLGYDGTEFSVGGGTEFTIQKFGTGFLNASIDSAKNFELNGGLRADTRLFDQADMKLWYRSRSGFGGSGTLAITKPGKIKGLKSARLSAKYEDSVFSATGDVIPDIPGLKSASLTVTYANDALDITGQVAIDDRVPGVQKANITVTVKQADAGWNVGASGQVTPKLPGLSGAQLDFSYDDGSVLLEGEFTIKKGPLDGKVKAGVTNAAVDDKGARTGKGSGDKFTVFGAADIKAEFIKDKLDGMLKLRLLPDGSVRVGGGLSTRDFEVFGKYPKDGGEFFNKTFETPPMPVPGLGITVGSVSVGVTFSASITAKAHACIGPGKLSGIKVEIKEFNPANVDPSTLEIEGGGTFDVYGDAGFGASAQVNLILGAAVAELVGSVGAEANAGIPAETPILSASSHFTYSQAKGLDITNTFKLSISPELKFRLFGKVSARLNLLVDTVTVWSKDWTLAEASYKLPVAINASGSLGYNAKTGKITPEKASDAINVEKPKLDADTMKGVVSGDTAPPSVKTEDKQGNELGKEELKDLPQSGAANASSAAPQANRSVMPQREDDAPAGNDQSPLDESIIGQLGTGVSLDLATRGYFEQRMGIDFSRVQIHTTSGAARQAERLHAKAFTVGEHIAFAQGEYRPDNPDGQELIIHELAHIAQQQGGAGRLIFRWPAVTATPAHTSETPASIKAKSLSDFVSLTEAQPDWATSVDIQADSGSLGKFREVQTFADGPSITDACGNLNLGDLIGKGVPAVFPALRKYAEGSTAKTTAWLRNTSKVDEAERWGKELTGLEAVVPPADLHLAMNKPDPVTAKSPFERLEDPGKFELTNFETYVTASKPVLSAEDGSEVSSYLALRAEGVKPESYKAPKISNVVNFHHFTKSTLDGLAENESVPEWKQNFWMTERPLTVVLYPAVDHNGAFHRNAGLERMVTDSSILTIVVEGLATVADYQSELAPVATRYGVGGKIQQAMVGGHGNSNILVLAGTSTTNDSLGTTGVGAANTAGLMTALTALMDSDPTKRRIVLDACLTNSHAVAAALRATPADAAADVQMATAGNPSLRDFVYGIAGVDSKVYGANASFAPAQTTFMTPGTTDVGLSVPSDPDLISSKLEYVEFGTEPLGCMRAVLECWTTDQLAGKHDCQDAVSRRVAAGRSIHVPGADTWRESIIHPLYDLAVKHYWASGDSIRQMATLADKLFMLYWAHETTASQLNAALGVLTSTAHVDQVLGSVAAQPHCAATPRVALVIEQAWMQHTPARRANFMAALARYVTCQEAAGDLDMGLVLPHVPSVLTVPPPAVPAAEQLRLALLAANFSPLGNAALPGPKHIEFLLDLLGAGPAFPAALNISTALGGLTSEGSILEAIGKPLSAPATGPKVKGPPPAANIDTKRGGPGVNEFRVTPMHREGEVTTAKDDLMVRSTPTTSTDANTIGRLTKGTKVFVVGEYDKDWYAIEQPGGTGFTAKKYITLLP